MKLSIIPDYFPTEKKHGIRVGFAQAKLPRSGRWALPPAAHRSERWPCAQPRGEAQGAQRKDGEESLEKSTNPVKISVDICFL